MTKAALGIPDYFYGDPHYYADHVHEQDLPTHSKLLGPDGSPLKYEKKQKIGFDLRPSSKKGIL